MSQPQLAELSASDRAQILAVMQRGIYDASSGSRSDSDVHICFGCVSRAKDVIDRHEKDKALWRHDILKDNFDFWKQSMYFITATRDESTALSLGKRLSDIASNCDTEGHVPVPFLADRSMLLSVLLTVYRLVRLAFVLGPASKTAVYRTNGRWPGTFEDVFPRGVGPSLGEVLDLWLEWDMVDVRELLFILAQVADGNLLPTVLLGRSAEERDKFARTVCDRLQDAFQNLHARPYPVYQYLLFIRLLYSPDHWRGMKLVFAGHGNQLIRLASQARHPDTLALFNTNHQAGALRLNAGSIIAALVSRSDAEYGRAKQKHWLETMPFDASHDGFARFLRMAKGIEDAPCRSPTCTSPEAATKLRCARCKVARYCSQECQTAHWTLASLPHKATCLQLRDLQRRIDVDLCGRVNAETFSRKCRERNVTVDELIVILCGIYNRLDATSFTQLLKVTASQ